MNLPPVFGSRLREVVATTIVSLPRLIHGISVRRCSEARSTTRPALRRRARNEKGKSAASGAGSRAADRRGRGRVHLRSGKGDPTLLVVDVTARPEIPVAQLEEEVDREIDALQARWCVGRRGGKSDRTDRNGSGRVAPIGVAREPTGCPCLPLTSANRNWINEQAERYRSVTVERVNRLRRREIRRRQPRQPPVCAERRSRVGKHAMRGRRCNLMVTSLRPSQVQSEAIVFPDFIDERLPSGIRLVTAPVAKLPVVTVLVIVRCRICRRSAW